MWLVWLVLAGVAGALLLRRQRRSRLVEMVEKQFPGPKALPILGNSLSFSANSEQITNTMNNFANSYDRFFRIWTGPEAMCIFFQDTDVETLLSSNTHISKGDIYKFTFPWIGTGLLTSTGSKWKSHRRIITPTFHFKILEEFGEVFNTNGRILCKKLEAVADGKTPVDIFPFVNLYALDNIAETAMGTPLNVQMNSESVYVRAIKDMCRVVNIRVFRPWLMLDFIFNLSKWGKIQKDALEVLHTKTLEVIQARRAELQEKKKREGQKVESEDDGINQKRRLAFLDVLIEAEETLTDEEIREEVDTFMFEGHDTVSSGIAFALYSLAANPEIQEEVYREQVDMFGDTDRDPTYKELQEMKYLDRFIKEAQRLYPSVPVIARKMHEDLTLSDGVVVPKGATASIVIAKLHKDPKNFPNPEVFNPDNFLQEATSKRNPYAYVPFSAGPRNCIGQRFAVQELKSAVSKVVRRFKLSKSSNPDDEVRPVFELVTVSANGIKVILEPRK